MKLSIKGLAITAALLWGIALLLVGTANIIWPPYGSTLLELVSSIYPGYETGSGFSGVVVCTLYGIFDAGIGGAIFAWLYNMFAA